MTSKTHQTQRPQFIPVSQIPQTIKSQTQAPQSPVSSIVKGNCSENSFFNGHECVCEVGYGFTGRKCVVLSISQPIPIFINPKVKSVNYIQNNSEPSSNNQNTQPSAPQQSVEPIHQRPLSVIPSNTSPGMCPSHAYDNGLGTCVCQSGYFYSNSQCILGTPCGSGSTRQADGSCKCD